MHYKHTQISYPMIIITLAILAFFIYAYITASLETPSYNSGPNFAMTSIMTLIVIILSSFTSLRVSIDKKYLRIKFGYGIYQKKFQVNEIISAKSVKNKRYYGRGIKVRFWPKMIIYSVSGLDAVEIKIKKDAKTSQRSLTSPLSRFSGMGIFGNSHVMKNNKVYRIGTDEAKKLEQAILKSK